MIIFFLDFESIFMLVIVNIVVVMMMVKQVFMILINELLHYILMHVSVKHWMDQAI